MTMLIGREGGAIMDRLKNLENIDGYLESALDYLDLVEKHWDNEMIDEKNVEHILYAAEIINDIKEIVKDEIKDNKLD